MKDEISMQELNTTRCSNCMTILEDYSDIYDTCNTDEYISDYFIE